MNAWTAVRKRHLYLMTKTIDILGYILRDVSQETATTLRDLSDGDKGWTVVEVVCHLRDFDDIFHKRAQMMLDQDYPDLPAYDHEAMAIDQAYNSQTLTDVYQQLVESREGFIEFFQSLSDDDWEKAGVHPEKGHFTMTDALMQVGLHDVIHLDQITQILSQQNVVE